MKSVYIRYNPLHEEVVCAHSSEDLECDACINAREKLKNTAYSLKGYWLSIDSNIKLCYCGQPVDELNSDCIQFQLCEKHALDS